MSDTFPIDAGNTTADINARGTVDADTVDADDLLLATDVLQ